MPFNLIRALYTILLCSLLTLQADATDNLFLPEKRIVGGEVAKQDAWPWMSALVTTYEGIPTKVVVNDVIYTALPLNFTPAGNAEGSITHCHLGDQVCDAQNKICLIERGDINFSVKAENCESGGGIGVIIYNNTDGALLGNLGEGFSGTIPVVGVSQNDGRAILSSLDTNSTVFVGAQPEMLQNSNCGASFIGGSWVLTAAHCVDESTAHLISVNIGEHDLTDGADNAITIKNIYRHADYNSEVISSDIALLELTRSVNSPAVSLADVSTTVQYEFENSLATVMGWGGRVAYTQGDGETSDFPSTLHQVNLNLYTNDECKDVIAESLDIIDTQTKILDNMICAGVLTDEKGACQGDSGGPLVVETGQGWQQVGIVSWGYGCAVEGLPGVYTRVSSFNHWIEAITSGIAIEQNLDFDVTPVGSQTTGSLRVNNNSNQLANLTYRIEDSRIKIDDSNCKTLSPNESCLLHLTFTASSAGKVDQYLSITTDSNIIKTSRSLITARAVDAAIAINSQINTNDAITWFTGGDSNWQINAAGGVQSGVIQDSQSSILFAKIVGEGTLSFEWSVSSEQNTDQPSEPYDALYFYVNGHLTDFISGEEPFSDKQITLKGEQNTVYWVYEKDYADPPNLAVEDIAYVRNISFTGGNVIAPSQGVGNTSTSQNDGSNDDSVSSGGFSLNWIMLLIMTLGTTGRRYLP